MITKEPVSLIMNATEFQQRFPNAEKDWGEINDRIDGEAEGGAREINPDRRLLGLGARPSRIDGERV